MRGAALLGFALAGCDAIFGSTYQPDAPPVDAAPLPDLMIAPPTDDCFLATFPGDSIGKQWVPLFANPRIQMREDATSGLVLTLADAMASEYNGVLAARAFDLGSNGRVEAKVSIYPAAGQHVALMITAADPNRAYQILVSRNDTAIGFAYVASPDPPMMPIVHAAPVDGQRWFRIRQEGTTVYFEASRDGATWGDSVALENQATLTTAAVWLVGGVNADTPTSNGMLGWDDVEIRWDECVTP